MRFGHLVSSVVLVVLMSVFASVATAEELAAPAVVTADATDSIGFPADITPVALPVSPTDTTAESDAWLSIENGSYLFGAGLFVLIALWIKRRFTKVA